MNETIALRILQRVDELQREVAFIAKLWETIATRTGIAEATTLSVAEAARFFGVDRSTVRARFADVLVRFPGGRRDRVPVDSIRAAFVSSQVAKVATASRKGAVA